MAKNLFLCGHFISDSTLRLRHLPVSRTLSVLLQLPRQLLTQIQRQQTSSLQVGLIQLLPHTSMPDLKTKHCKGMTQHDNYLPSKAFGSFKTTRLATRLANKLICICGSHWVGFEWNDIIWYDNCYDMEFLIRSVRGTTYFWRNGVIRHE